jgi:hypothetical protein
MRGRHLRRVATAKEAIACDSSGLAGQIPELGGSGLVSIRQPNFPLARLWEIANMINVLEALGKATP